jgi:hypothetical protein
VQALVAEKAGGPGDDLRELGGVHVAQALGCVAQGRVVLWGLGAANERGAGGAGEVVEQREEVRRVAVRAQVARYLRQLVRVGPPLGEVAGHRLGERPVLVAHG